MVSKAAKAAASKYDRVPTLRKFRRAALISSRRSKYLTRCEFDPQQVKVFVFYFSPSTEWQDRVTALLTSSLQSRPHLQPSAPSATSSNTISLNDPNPPLPLQSQHASIQLPPLGGHVRRQRRRVDGDEGDGRSSSPQGFTVTRNGSTSPRYSPSNTSHTSGSGYAPGYMGASTDSDSEDDVVDAVGQLSLNEDEQVRYHGKASGLYLLGINAKEEARNEGGIW